MAVDCRHVREALWRALDGEATGDALMEVGHHLESCAACRGELAGAVRLERALLERRVREPVSLATFLERRPERAAPADASAVGLEPRAARRRRPGLIAAGVVVAVVVAGAEDSVADPIGGNTDPPIVRGHVEALR